MTVLEVEPGRFGSWHQRPCVWIGVFLEGIAIVVCPLFSLPHVPTCLVLSAMTSSGRRPTDANALLLDFPGSSIVSQNKLLSFIDYLVSSNQLQQQKMN
jgi:hypothetical protein